MFYCDVQDVILRFALDLAPEFADRFERFPNGGTANYIADELRKKAGMFAGMNIDEPADLLRKAADEIDRRSERNGK